MNFMNNLNTYQIFKYKIKFIKIYINKIKNQNKLIENKN